MFAYYLKFLNNNLFDFISVSSHMKVPNRPASSNLSTITPPWPRPTPTSSQRHQITTKENVPQVLPVTRRLEGDYALEDLVPIQMGFCDLYPHLQPECSEVDKIVKYILDLNISVRFLNVKFSHKAALLDVENLMVACSNFRHQRFSLGQNGDEGKILKRWSQLVKELSIQSPLECLKTFKTTKKVSNFLLMFYTVGIWILNDQILDSTEYQRSYCLVLRLPKSWSTAWGGPLRAKRPGR